MTYVLCLIEQGIVSLLNIGLNIWLVRVGGSELSGVYAFWFNVSLLAGSVQYGLATCHLAPLPPGPGTMPQRRPTERALLAASLALTAASSVVVAAIAAIAGSRGGADLSAAILFVPAYLGYQYARALAYSRGALVAVTWLTAAVAGITVAGLAALHLLAPESPPGHVLLIAAAAYGLPSAVMTWRVAAGLRLRWRDLRRYLPYASISRWSVIGIVGFEAMNRVPSFAAAGWLGAAALGRMSVTQIPTRPPILLVAALQPMLRTDLAGRRQRGDWSGFVGQTLRGGLAALAVNALWVIPIGLAWPFLASWLFHGRFTDDVGLGLLWAASQTIGSLIVVAATAYQVCGAFRMIGLADLGGAAGTVLGLVVLMPLFGVDGVVAAMILGQAGYLAMTVLQWPRLRAFMPNQPAPEPALLAVAVGS